MIVGTLESKHVPHALHTYNKSQLSSTLCRIGILVLACGDPCSNPTGVWIFSALCMDIRRTLIPREAKKSSYLNG